MLEPVSRSLRTKEIVRTKLKSKQNDAIQINKKVEQGKFLLTQSNKQNVPEMKMYKQEPRPSAYV